MPLTNITRSYPHYKNDTLTTLALQVSLCSYCTRLSDILCRINNDKLYSQYNFSLIYNCCHMMSVTDFINKRARTIAVVYTPIINTLFIALVIQYNN